MAYRDDPQAQTMIANLADKTGKPLDDWLALLRATGLQKHGDLMKLLKGEHGVSHGYANLVSLIFREETADAPPPTEDDLVATQYAAKPGLRPLYERLVAFVQTLGDDVTIAPKKTTVSLRRAKQFALIKPSTKTRIDLGVQLKGQAPEGRLEDGKMWNGMCSHRIQLSHPDDVDDEVRDWLTRAYEAAV